MTSITPVTSTTTTNSQTQESTAALSSDFDTFLKMLTAQIQNQDPLNPMDSSDYAVQLATFSGVEQQVQTNDLLRELTSSSMSEISNFAGWVGMEALAEGPVSFDGTPVAVQFDLPAGSAKAELVVSDTNGDEIYRKNITGETSPYDWTGVSATGAKLTSDKYYLHIESTDAAGDTTEAPVTSFARVVELRDGTNGPEIVLAHGGAISVNDVTALREAQAATEG